MPKISAVRRLATALTLLIAPLAVLAPTAAHATSRTQGGYWMLAADGHVYGFGGASDLGSPTSIPGRVKVTPTPTGNGYWVLSDSGSIYSYGDAKTFGAVPYLPDFDEDYTTMASTPSGKGYWLFTNKGRVMRFGDATFFGDMSNVALNGSVLDAVATPTGRGYYMVASDGGVFNFGDAKFSGSTGSMHLNKPVMSLAPDPDGAGYWLVASDGGIFGFDAPFYGSAGSLKLNKPISSLVASPTGHGYLMVGQDGGIFSYGDVPFFGSLGGNPPAFPVVSVAAIGDPPPAPIYHLITSLTSFVSSGTNETKKFSVDGDEQTLIFVCSDNGSYSYGCSYEVRDGDTGEIVDMFMSDAFSGDARTHLFHLDAGTYYIQGDEFGDNTLWGVSMLDKVCGANCLQDL